jgi:hypothetical protein
MTIFKEPLVVSFPFVSKPAVTFTLNLQPSTCTFFIVLYHMAECLVWTIAQLHEGTHLLGVGKLNE